MNGYAILSGGGVKGAALAGCMAAATDKTIDFIGFGGTSAGAIMALLGASGYRGHAELKRMAVQDLDFNALLDDGGKYLREVKSLVDVIAIKGSWYDPFLLKKKFDAGKRVISLVSPKLGLYDGHKLKVYLFRKVCDRLTTLKDDPDFTFEDFHAARGLPLRVIASDLQSRKAEIFSLERTPRFPVLRAVLASAAYPFVFQPVTSSTFPSGGLVDGGLASNLPVFLFADEHLKNRVPVFAFDLVPKANQVSHGGNYDLNNYCRDLLSTALEAGDALLKQNIRSGIVYIPIETTNGVDALDFDIREDKRDHLFANGYSEASKFLSTQYAPLKHKADAGRDLKKKLQSIYGPPEFYAPILKGIAMQIEEHSNAGKVRISIMLPTGRDTKSRIVVYDHGFHNASDVELELPEFGGCSGQALSPETAGIAFDDLDKTRMNPRTVGLERWHMDAVPSDRRSIISIAIPGWTNFDEIDSKTSTEYLKLPRIAALSIDSAIELNKTGWLVTNANGEQIISEKIDNLLTDWSNIIGKLLP